MKKWISTGTSIFVIFCIIISIPISIVNNVKAEDWNKETVDSTDDVGACAQIIIDSNDNPHICYYDSTNKYLKYTKWTGNDWKIEIVDNNTLSNFYLSMALDSQDFPHICYVDDESRTLRYSKWDGNSWNVTYLFSVFIELIFANPINPSIDIDSQDNVHISFYERNEQILKYIKWNGSDWSIESVVDTYYNCLYDKMIVANNDYPLIGYFLEGESLFKFARWDGSKWRFESFNILDKSEDQIYSPSITLDDMGNLHLSYGYIYDWDSIYDGNNFDFNADLRHANWDGSIVSIDTIDFNGMPYGTTSIAVDSNNDPYIIYCNLNLSNYENLDSKLENAQWTGKNWTTDIIDQNGEIGLYNSIAIDNNDALHVGYYDKTNGDLKYAKKSFYKIPSKPQMLQATPGNSQITLSWTGPANEGGLPITGYKIYCGEKSGELTLIKKLGNDLAYIDKDVTNDITYYYQIRAANMMGDSPFSKEVYATPKKGEASNDQDNDNLPDSWEIEYLGDLSYSANDDPDNDNFTNLEEYNGRSDPNDVNDVPGNPKGENDAGNFILILMLIIVIIIIIIVGIIFALIRRPKTLQGTPEWRKQTPQQYPPQPQQNQPHTQPTPTPTQPASPPEQPPQQPQPQQPQQPQQPPPTKPPE